MIIGLGIVVLVVGLGAWVGVNVWLRAGSRRMPRVGGRL